MDENPMARSDMEFRQYVCDLLRKHDDELHVLKSQTDEHIKITKDIREIVEMGRALFVFAGYIGGAIKWLSAVAVASVLLYQLLIGSIKDLFK